MSLITQVLLRQSAQVTALVCVAARWTSIAIDRGRRSGHWECQWSCRSTGRRCETSISVICQTYRGIPNSNRPNPSNRTRQEAVGHYDTAYYRSRFPSRFWQRETFQCELLQTLRTLTVLHAQAATMIEFGDTSIYRHEVAGTQPSCSIREASVGLGSDNPPRVVSSSGGAPV